MNAAPPPDQPGPPDDLNAAPSAEPTSTAASAGQGPRRPDWRFMLDHPAHCIALGFGSGLSPWAPGTVGTLWGWMSFLLLDRGVHVLWGDAGWGIVIALGFVVGWWACQVTALNLRQSDPGAIVWDEVLAIWLVLWIVTPASWWTQLLAFALFRYFDAAKPGPVRWADQHYKGGGWRGAFGILFDDGVAALCTLFTLAVAVAVQRALGG